MDAVADESDGVLPSFPFPWPAGLEELPCAGDPEELAAAPDPSESCWLEGGGCVDDAAGACVVDAAATTTLEDAPAAVVESGNGDPKGTPGCAADHEASADANETEASDAARTSGGIVVCVCVRSVIDTTGVVVCSSVGVVEWVMVVFK